MTLSTRARVALAACALAMITPIGLAAAQQRATPTCFGVPATIVGTPDSDPLLIGGPGRDVIVGLGGDDRIVGGGGDDLLCGGSGSDIILGGPGNDRINGGDGQDGLSGNAGNDELDGGGNLASANVDFVDYEQAPAAVQIDLAGHVVTGGDGTDRLKAIEGAFASPYDDTLIGDTRANLLGGEAGNDHIDGGGGNDAAWFDAPVTASLATDTASGEGSDNLIAMEGLIGSEGSDTLIGDGGANDLVGRAGNDVISGGAGDDREFGDAGADHVDGGAGNDSIEGGDGSDTLVGGGDPQDTVSYLSAGFSGVTVDLATDQATGGEGSDTLSGFTNVSGSQFRDRIVGDAQANALTGNAGNDTISGGPGADFVGGGAGANTVAGGTGEDYCLQGSGARRCELHGIPHLPRVALGKPPTSGSARTTAHSISWLTRRPADRGELGLMERKLRGLEEALAPRTALAGSTPAYEYVGAPTCFVAQHPYRTSIAPPRRVDPVGRDNEPEEAWWQGNLFRLSTGTQKWQNYRQTAWARATIAGSKQIAGAPVWQNRSQTGLISTFSFTVPPGRYTWRAKLYWKRNGAFVVRPVEPHIIYAPAVRHAQDCRFGS